MTTAAPNVFDRADIEDEDDDQPEDFDERPEDEAPPRGRHMDGCLWSGGGWNCDGACPEGAEAYRDYCESIEALAGKIRS
jgi:hypothetical protein